MEKNTSDTLYQIGLWLVKLMEETNADQVNYTLEGVTNKEGKKLGNYQLTFKKKK